MSNDKPYISKTEVTEQYRPNGYGLSPGLIRARRVFRVRNAITGIVVGAFAVGVWAYSIRAVRQDTLEELDEEAKALLNARTAADEERKADKVKEVAPTSVASASSQLLSASPSTVLVHAPRNDPGESTGELRGLLANFLASRYPGVLDPDSRTLVWGAPSVDSIGRIGDSNAKPSQA